MTGQLRKLLLCLIFVVHFFKNVSCCERGHDVQFLADFVERLNHSNKVMTHLCWRKDDLVALSKMLSRSFVSHSVLGDFNLYSNYHSIHDGNNVFVLNITCHNSVEYLTQGLQKGFFDSTNIWIIFAELPKIEFNNFYFPFNSLVYVVEREKDIVSVKVICKYSQSQSDYDIVDIAEWKLNEQFLYFNKFLISSNRSDLKGQPVRVSFVLSDNDTLNHLSDYRDLHIDKLTKANYILVSYLLEMVNASKVDVWAETWGYKNDVTKTFNGMYGDLLLDRADLAGTPGLMQIIRQKHFRFIPPTSPAKTNFLFRAPPLSYTANIFTLPFTASVWVTFLCLMLLSMVLVYFIMVFEWRKTLKTNSKVCKTSISDVVFLEWSILTQRGNAFEPKFLSGKMVYYFTSVLCLYMYTGFSGYILVLLQSTSESITDLPSLYHSKMDVGVEDVSYNRYYFTTPNEDSNETYRKLLYEKRIAPKNNWFTPRDGLEKVRKGFFAFHVEVGAGFALIRETFTEEEKCKIRICDTIFDTKDIFVAVPRNSVYTEIFLVGFRKIFERGLQKREHLKFYATKPQCIGRQGNYDSVRLVDCYFPFLILGLGFIISCFIYLVEILFYDCVCFI